MNLHAVYGLFAQGVIVAALIRFVRILFGKARSKPHGAELWLPLMILLAGSAEGISLAAHVRGIWGDPSVVTLLILFLFTLQPSWLPPKPRPSTCLVIAIPLMLALYAPLFVPIPTVQGGFYARGFAAEHLLWPLGLACIGLFIAGVAGYDPSAPSNDAVGVLGLKAANGYVPALLLAAAAVFAFRFPLTEARHRIIRRRLEQRAARAARGTDGRQTVGDSS